MMEALRASETRLHGAVSQKAVMKMKNMVPKDEKRDSWTSLRTPGFSYRTLLHGLKTSLLQYDSAHKLARTWLVLTPSDKITNAASKGHFYI
jgi:hypothetical protein